MISYKINYNLIKEGEKIMAELMASNFVHNAIDEDLKEGKYTEGIHTRFLQNQMDIYILDMQNPYA